MDRKYNLNEIAMMTGFSTRTLRNYLNQGLLKGEKVDGAWQFTAEDVERFFAEPFVKEGLRIKRNSIVFDLLADRAKESKKTCLMLDMPASLKESKALSELFCKQMESVSAAVFTFDWNAGNARIILSGAEESVASIMAAYHGMNSDD